MEGETFTGAKSYLRDGRTNEIVSIVTSFKYHEEYSDQFDFDVCVVLAASDLLSDTRQPVCLYKEGESLPAIGTPLYIAGTGKTQNENQSGFREGKVELMTYKYCNSQEAYTGFVKPASMFCAGYPEGEVDSCSGDSGGPIVQLEERASDGKVVPRLIGLVSWGRSDACAVAGFPGVYAKISAVHDWIHSTAIELIEIHVFPTTTTTTTTTTTPFGPVGLSNLNLPSHECESVFDETRSVFRIIGGSTSDDILESWPWMGNLNAECGAVLISQRFALTAAHCCDSIDLHKKSVFFGSSKLVDRNSIQVDIESFKIHPDYKTEHFVNDICLIRFKSDVEYTQSTFPICFSEEEMNVGEHGYIAGWGLTKENGFQSSTLREAVVPISDINSCNATYGGIISDNQYCAGFSDGLMDACKGDSGGPLVQMDIHSTPKLAGIISWGEGCAKPGFPTVYTKISSYTSWIHEASSILNGQRICQNPKDYISSDPEVVYHCDSISGLCSVECGNGAKPNVESVQCQYAAGLSRSGEELAPSWKIVGNKKPFNEHVTSTNMRAASKNEKQSKKAAKKQGKNEKKIKKGKSEKTIDLFVPKFVSTGNELGI